MTGPLPYSTPSPVPSLFFMFFLCFVVPSPVLIVSCRQSSVLILSDSVTSFLPCPFSRPSPTSSPCPFLVLCYSYPYSYHYPVLFSLFAPSQSPSLFRPLLPPLGPTSSAHISSPIVYPTSLSCLQSPVLSPVLMWSNTNPPVLY